MHHVLSIPSSPLLWSWHAGTPWLAVYSTVQHSTVHLSPTTNQAQLPPAAASASPHSAVSLPFQPIGHLAAVFPFARYPRVVLSICLGHEGEATMHAKRRLTLAQSSTGSSTATLFGVSGMALLLFV